MAWVRVRNGMVGPRRVVTGWVHPAKVRRLALNGLKRPQVLSQWLRNKLDMEDKSTHVVRCLERGQKGL